MCLWPKIEGVKSQSPAIPLRKSAAKRTECLHLIKFKGLWQVPLTLPFKDVAGRGKPPIQKSSMDMGGQTG